MSAALMLGVALAVGSLAYVLYPLLRGERTGSRGRSGSAAQNPATVSASAAGRREVTDEEIEAAVQAFRDRHFGPGTCRSCGPRPESDALYCSSCGRPLDEPLPRRPA